MLLVQIELAVVIAMLGHELLFAGRRYRGTVTVAVSEVADAQLERLVRAREGQRDRGVRARGEVADQQREYGGGDTDGSLSHALEVTRRARR